MPQPEKRAETWWQHPEAYLFAWDMAAGNAHFLPMERATLRRSVFLDQRIKTDLANARPVPIAEVLASPISGARKDPAFIFHTAFCCSTLLAQSLDRPDHALVLREPCTLLQLADLKHNPAADIYRLDQMLDSTLDLLARPFSPDEKVIIKPTNLNNSLIPELLAARPASKALILYDELEPFLISVFKQPKKMAPIIEAFLQRLLRDPAAGKFSQEATNPRGLPQCAALAWALQIVALQRQLAENDPTRIRLLRTPELLAQPATTIEAASQWLGAPLPPGAGNRIAMGPLWTHHSKQSTRPYTPAQRHRDQALARRLLAEPLRTGLAWADKHRINRQAAFPAGLRLLT